MDRSGIFGRRIQIAGSASWDTDPSFTQYAHNLVSRLVQSVVRGGGGLVLGVGKEPRPQSAAGVAPSIVFDWTVLEIAAKDLQSGTSAWPNSYGPPIVVVTSGKSETEIPKERRELWDSLLLSNLIRVETIQAGARSGAMLRERQAQFGDILVIMGGGTGVEHLADLYMSRRRPVIPLDIPLGASRKDGTGGSERLALKSRGDPDRFVRLRKQFAGTSNTRLASIATREASVDVDCVANNLSDLLSILASPRVFYTRLLNRKHKEFHAVESFFRNVVDPVVSEFGYDRIDMEIDDAQHAFLNLAVFDDLHYASVVVADVTGERPNCYIELGYALGNGTRVIVTAEEGTKRPFDQDAIPCHFWNVGFSNDDRRRAFSQFWRKNIDRPRLIG